MTDKFSIIPVERLLTLILEEYKDERIFGIPKDLFFTPNANDTFRLQRFGQLLETPIGVAAGPHTQMAQNIISAWLCGARYMELKTVQTLDELEISKPCIDMQDEGYNCEWSQELKIHESYGQYLDAWIIIHILKDIFGWEQKEAGVIFNMSVGYNMEGILKDNVQWFFNKMQNCSEEKNQKIEILSNIYPRVKNLNIPDCISNNITLSTMHGCPPDEIEKIGLYLIKNKKLHTTVKLNPTLIGSFELRYILNNQLGFPTVVPDEAFEHDLKYNDALNIIKSLQNAAEQNHVHFGLKLTNTLESMNIRNVFSKTEKMNYMSGRALHPISINLARKLQIEFNGTLDISFSAGADCFNITNTLACGLFPVTVCSDILKPGGYGRLTQYLTHISTDFANQNIASIEDGILKKASLAEKKYAIVKNLNEYAEFVKVNPDYFKYFYSYPTIKTNQALEYFDCAKAPCIDTCPTNQDIPDYLYFASKGEFQKAWDVIMRTNPFPSVLGMVCDHTCQLKCTRINYDDSLLIREVKRFISEQNFSLHEQKTASGKHKKVSIVGAGPSGLSCAYFLALAGFDVEIFEAKDIPGGMVSDAIPSFRLSDEAIDKDIKRIVSLGVNINYNTKITKEKFDSIKAASDFVYIAVGAQKAKDLGIPGEDAFGVLDSLKFLSAIRRGTPTHFGKKVLVIGGGNTAMDVARTSYRLVGKDGEVKVIYRRTIADMPADREEISALIEEQIPILELLAPESIITENGRVKGLKCSKMELSGTDEKGRRKPVKIPNSETIIECDTIIPALGQDTIFDFINESLLGENTNNYSTNQSNIFIGGDAMRGGATIIKAVADGKKVAIKIMTQCGIKPDFKIHVPEKELSLNQYLVKRSIRQHKVEVDETEITNRRNFNQVVYSLPEADVKKESARCLQCDNFCGICTTVCPNRANYTYEVNPEKINLQKIVIANNKAEITNDRIFEIKQKFQILNIFDFCNECGNCSTFCPSSGRPFADKPKIHLTQKSFNISDQGYYLKRNGNSISLFYKQGEHISVLTYDGSEYIFETGNGTVNLSAADFSITNFKIREGVSELYLTFAAEMKIMLQPVTKLYT